MATCKGNYKLKDKIIFDDVINLKASFSHELVSSNQPDLIWKNRYSYPIENFRYIRLGIGCHQDVLKIFPNLRQIYLDIPVPSCKIPLSVKNILINTKEEIEGRLHEGIEKVYFEYVVYRHDIEDLLPKGIKLLLLCTTGKEHINYLPDSIQWLDTGHYCQTISCFPKSLKKLYLGPGFNQSLQGMLPNTLEFISLGYDFNQPIDNTFPSSVTTIIFGHRFNQLIRNHLPKNLRILCFGDNFCQSIEGAIPGSVQKIWFGYRFLFNHYDGSHLPNGLLDLTISSLTNITPTSIPSSVKRLTFRSRIHSLLKNYIPNSVQELNLLFRSREPVKDFLPPSVKRLTIGSEYEPGRLPSFVENVSIAGGYRIIGDIFVEGQKVIEFTGTFDQAIDFDIPRSVTTIIMGSWFNHNIDHLPATVKHLELGYHFAQDLGEALLIHLDTLVLNYKYRKHYSGCIARLARYSVIVRWKN